MPPTLKVDCIVNMVYYNIMHLPVLDWAFGCLAGITDDSLQLMSLCQITVTHQ